MNSDNVINIVNRIKVISEAGLKMLGDWEMRPPFVYTGQKYITLVKIIRHDLYLNPRGQADFIHLFGKQFPFNYRVNEFYVNPDLYFNLLMEANANEVARSDIWMIGAHGYLCFDIIVYCEKPHYFFLLTKLIDFVECYCIEQDAEITKKKKKTILIDPCFAMAS